MHGLNSRKGVCRHGRKAILGCRNFTSTRVISGSWASRVRRRWA
jgi:hypothetical protein